MTKLSPITDNISIIPKKLSIILIKYIEPILQTLINCHAEGSKQVCLSTTLIIINYIVEEAIHLGNNATVFQAEVLQWEERHPTLYSPKSKTKIAS